MPETRVEVVVFHLGVSLVKIPVVQVESVDGAHDSRTMAAAGGRFSVFIFAAFVVAAIVGLAFAAGYLIGRIFL